MACPFVVGQKVVCVDDELTVSSGWHFKNGIKFGLVRGKIYTVERVYIQNSYYRGVMGKSVCLSLIELKKPICPQVPADDGFNALRFRPVVQRKTDISIFTRMLNPSKTSVPA